MKPRNITFLTFFIFLILLISLSLGGFLEQNFGLSGGKGSENNETVDNNKSSLKSDLKTNVVNHSEFGTVNSTLSGNLNHTGNSTVVGNTTLSANSTPSVNSTVAGNYRRD